MAKDMLMGRLSKFIPPRDQWTAVDEALYGVEDIYNVSEEKAKKLREDAIRYSFKHHYENNKFYHEYCKNASIKPEDIKTEEDFNKIPLVPDTFFKSYPDDKNEFLKWLEKIYTGKLPKIVLKKRNSGYDDIIEELVKKEVYLTFSTGITGRFSFMPRDQITFYRGLFSNINEMKLALQYDDLDTLKPFPPKDTCIAAFIPNPSKTYFWGSRVIEGMFNYIYKESDKVYMVDKPFTTELIRNVLMGIMVGGDKKLGDFSPKKMISTYVKHLKKWGKEGKKVMFWGFPFGIDSMISGMEKKRIKFNFDSVGIYTVGGWNSFARSMAPEEFSNKIEEYFGSPEEYCRDFYFMNEMNVLIPECKFHYKHIPYFMQSYVLDEKMNPLPYGEYGRFAFLDPLANSYPGFITTGDKVKMLEHCPECDRPGPVLAPEISRMPGTEPMGCTQVITEILKETGG